MRIEFLTVGGKLSRPLGPVGESLHGEQKCIGKNIAARLLILIEPIRKRFGLLSKPGFSLFSKLMPAKMSGRMMLI